MEGSESAMNRVGRVMWTVWGYLTGAVGRYLRPVVTNEEAQNVKVKQEALQINKSYKELKEKEEETEQNETKTSESKTREDLKNSGISVRAAAVQWEKGNIARDGHEVKDKNKHTYSSSEGIAKKYETKKDDEKALDNESESRKIQLTAGEDSPVYTDADVKNRDTTFPACREDHLNVQRSETNQEQTKTPTEKGLGLDETQQEATKSEFIDQGLRKKSIDEEQGADEFMRNENHETEKPIKRHSFDQDFLTKELNVERSEKSQEQSGNEERENGDAGEPVKSKLLEEGLLTEEADLNAERIECSQEQGREQEEDGVEIMLREKKEAKEESVQSKLLEQASVTKEADLNAAENSQEQEEDQEEAEECVGEIIKRKRDEKTGENEISDQCLLTVESDLNDERSERIHEQRRRQEEGYADEVMRRQDDEGEANEGEFTEQGIMIKEANLNVERNENSLALGRKEDEEGLDKILIRNETEEKKIVSIFIEQGLLAKETELIVERNENNQEYGMKQEEEEEFVDKNMKKEESEEEQFKNEFADQSLLINASDRNVERIENSQEQISKPKEEEEEEEEDEMLRGEYDETEEEPITDKVTKQGLEQASVCDMGETAEVQVVSKEKMLERVHDQDKNKKEQSISVATEHGHEASKSQMLDEGLFSQLITTRDGRDSLNDSQKLEEDMIENATLLQEKKVIEVDNKETKQETEGKEKGGHHEEFPAWEPFTGTGIVGEQKVGDTEMTETLKQVVEPECELLETARIENTEMYKTMYKCSTRLEDEHNHLSATTELQQLEQSEEQKPTSHVALNTEINQEHRGSQQPAVMTKQDVKGVIRRPETETGNQMETVETTLKLRAEVAALDVKKSAERETITHEKPIETEDVALQEVMGQCLHKQEFFLIESTDTRINELNILKAEFSEIKSHLLEQGDKTPDETVDEMASSSLEELEERSSSPKQTAEMFETLREVTEIGQNELKFEQARPECEISHVANTCESISFHKTPIEVLTNQDEFAMQDSSAETSSRRIQLGDETLYVPERASEQEIQEKQWKAEKDSEEQERTDEPEAGLAEIKDITSCSGVVEDTTNGLESLREMEALERNDHERELESHDETTENNMNVELPGETQECEKQPTAEMTAVESVVVHAACVTMESVKQMEEPVTEEYKETCQLVISESEKRCGDGRQGDGESAVDSKENIEDGGRPALKRGFEKLAGDNDEDKPSVLTDLFLPSQASSLDFRVQKSKIALKNPLVRPPKDPRMLINMASVEPSPPPPAAHPPHPSQPSFLKKSHIEGASGPSKGVIGIKLPGLGAAGFPTLRKNETGRKIRDEEDSERVRSQKSGSQSADDNVEQETPTQKPKWTPPRQAGMASPLMMAELKNKLKKTVKE